MINKYGFVRVGASILEMKVADVTFNADEMIRVIKSAAKKGIQILVFPELAITGYTCADLFHQKVLLDTALKELKRIVDETNKLDIVSIVGMPITLNNQLYNTGVVIQKGHILGIVPKTYIPNSSESCEKRWFSSSLTMTSKEIELFNDIVPIGTDLLFQSMKYKDICFGIEVGEDARALYPPSTYQALNGATILFNLSASNELIGKYEYRRRLVNNQSARCMASYVYASCGINESSTDVLFSGHAMISENGTMLEESERFVFDSQIIYTDVDIQKVMMSRYKNISDMGIIPEHCFRMVNFDINDINNELKRTYKQLPFVPKDNKKRDERCNEIFNIQSSALAKRLKHTGIKKCIIGISGGLDSTLAFLVTVKAYEKLGLDKKGIIAITMPGFGTTSRTYNNAVKLIEKFSTAFKEIDIKDACLQHLKDINHDLNLHDITYENVQARERTQILMDIANQENGLVIGTGDLSEMALGWCTYNGDHMSMYAVNVSIPKTLVKYLINWVADKETNNDVKEVLYDILNTKISPELLAPDDKNNIKQSTEDTIGPYILHDFFLYHFLRFGVSPQKLLFIAEKTFDGLYTREEITKWLRLFIKRFFMQQFKRSCLPDGPKVGTVSISPRGDLKMPSDAVCEVWLKDLEQ